MKYVFAIDAHNYIFIDDDDKVVSHTNMFGLMDSIGLVIYHKNATDERKARKELAEVFHARNFHMWEHMKEERGLI